MFVNFFRSITGITSTKTLSYGVIFTGKTEHLLKRPEEGFMKAFFQTKDPSIPRLTAQQ